MLLCVHSIIPTLCCDSLTASVAQFRENVATNEPVMDKLLCLAQSPTFGAKSADIVITILSNLSERYLDLSPKFNYIHGVCFQIQRYHS